MEYNKEIRDRFKRIEGQLKGVMGMMEQGKDCKEVVTQLSAVRSAVDRTIGLVVSTNLEQCLRDSMTSGEATDRVVKEAVVLLVKSL